MIEKHKLRQLLKQTTRSFRQLLPVLVGVLLLASLVAVRGELLLKLL